MHAEVWVHGRLNMKLITDNGWKSTETGPQGQDQLLIGDIL